VANFSSVHSGARLYEYAQVHGHRDKRGANYWQLVGLIAVNEAPSPETLNTRSDDATRLAAQQRTYAYRQVGKRQRRKQKQRCKRRQNNSSAEDNAPPTQPAKSTNHQFNSQTARMRIQ
jgi:hypothetical protein